MEAAAGSVVEGLGAVARARAVAASALLMCFAAFVLTSVGGRPATGGVHETGAREGLSALPLAALGPVSSTLGGADARYRVLGSRAANPAQRFGITFAPAGVAIRSGSGRISLRLAAFGHAGELSLVRPTSPRPRANRVSYAHRAVREWYLNGPLGLEQGFDVARRPSGRGALAVGIALSPGVIARLGGGGALLQGAGVSLRYAGLSASDARGRALRAWLVRDRHGLEIRVDDRDSHYPVRIDPLIQSGPKLVAGDESGAGRFGAGVAVSSDGNTALVGGPGDNNDVGAAWVFTRSGNTWTQQGSKFTGSGETGAAGFGARVALSADGNTALISGPADDNNGAVWVFTRSGNTWTQQGPKLQVMGPPPTTEPNEFGSSIALSADGNTALIGGMTPNGAAAEAWVFVRSSGTWTQQGPVLTATNAGADYSALSSVALSADGNTALLGAPATVRNQGIVSYGYAGAAWVFTRSGGTWSQQAELTPGGRIGSIEFGASVALSADGNTALIGAPDPMSTSDGGSAWVYTRASGAWAQQGPSLTGAGEAARGQFGASVALSGDGNTALVGGPNNNSNVGVAWAFARSGGTWTQAGASLIGGSESGAGGFGSSVTLSSDGGTGLIGGPGDNSQGAAWVFATGHALSVSLAGTGSGSVTGTGISCPGSCSQSYAVGSVVTLTASPASGSTFAGWSGGGCSGTGACQVTMSFDQTVTATFASATTTHTLKVSLAGSGSGTVASNPAGISCPSSCSHGYPSGSVVTLTPSPAAGSTFIGWSGGGCTGTGACHVTMSGDRTVSASFAATDPTVTEPTETHQVWREGKRAASLSRTRRPPVGTTFSFTLNERARVNFVFTQQVTGRKVRGKCVAETRRNQHAPACTRTVTLGTLVFTGHPGRNKVFFDGRLRGSKQLKLGRYTLIITATNAAGRRSKPQTLRFTIIK